MAGLFELCNHSNNDCSNWDNPLQSVSNLEPIEAGPNTDLDVDGQERVWLIWVHDMNLPSPNAARLEREVR